MKKPLLAATLTVLLSPAAFAATADTADATSPHSFSANVNLTNDYRFRGYSQTNMRPAIQGGFDYAHASGFYLGNWNSNVADEVFGNDIEMDVYGGYSTTFGDIGLDTGLLYYYYPGSEAIKGGNVDNAELYVGLSYGPFSAKYSHGLTDFFGVPDSKNNFYIDLGAEFDLGDGWGVNAHVGYQKLKNDAFGDYLDYKLGLTKAIDNWTLEAAVVSTNKKDWYQTSKGHDAGRPGIVVSVAHAF